MQRLFSSTFNFISLIYAHKLIDVIFLIHLSSAFYFSLCFHFHHLLILVFKRKTNSFFFWFNKGRIIIIIIIIIIMVFFGRSCLVCLCCYPSCDTFCFGFSGYCFIFFLNYVISLVGRLMIKIEKISFLNGVIVLNT